MRAVRAGMSAPSSSIANLWKMLVFLLHDCMPDGQERTMIKGERKNVRRQWLKSIFIEFTHLLNFIDLPYFLFLCVLLGSVYSMCLARVEQEEQVRSRELQCAREHELSRLIHLESQLQARVQKLDQTLRCIQGNRQEAEDSRSHYKHYQPSSI